MKWKPRFLLLALLSAPAFTNYPVTMLDREILAGISYGWVAYFLTANACIPLIVGRRFFATALAVAALISMPVVFTGAGVSYLLFLSGWGQHPGPFGYSAHYISLCISMLTVIPLALSMVAVVPFHDIEHNLLQNRSGVLRAEKFLLMFLRVFNHILYFVIPNILETIREEGRYRQWAQEAFKSAAGAGKMQKIAIGRHKIVALIREMTQLGVEGICGAIQYIPLWAVEIAQLPNRRPGAERAQDVSDGSGRH